MLEVNDFSAVRISLASPEQIRSWSYGEVTKPETINYRTFKPEKDGLFCERIFGPTKDFECYCGKYKRVRYKGIICDKCGVEVARSKVRRERMGHIELATPVAHIWFVKGTPSRLSLLLDISPRSLERVLYFAQYAVTRVDEEEKQRLIQHMRQELERERGAPQRELEQKLVELRAQRDEKIATFRSEKETQDREAEEELSRSVDQVMSETKVVEEAQKRVAELEEEHGRQREGRKALLDASVEFAQQQAAAEMEQIEHRLSEEREQLEATLAARIEELEDLKPRDLLTDGRYRELKEKYGNVFEAGMGAEAVLELLRTIDLSEMREQMKMELHSTSGQHRKKAAKTLRVVEAFRKSGNRPEWMILTVLPVLPPDLRPMVQLDGGRFATSDLNDLYRRVINRNNRLRRLLELGAPEIIIRNEKRMLQEAVDSLMDNGRRGRAVAGTNNHRLKSLSDMLKGKQGRFRQNLLGKRVDYSGRSVIVVGPELKLNQCGLPKRMALELFKPFVIHKLVQRGHAHNIKSAKRIVERMRPEVWDVLEDIIKDRPVLLNRAPTLHRLGIQAFQPILIEGSAIQVHPLVCSAFNADFDGDQMAVHVPLSKYAVEEANSVLLSIHNMLSPSSGEPTVAPTLDMVLGSYYMTVCRPGAKGEGMTFGSFDEARLAYDLDLIDLQAELKVRTENGDQLSTSVGRIIFNEVLPPELRFRNEVMDKKGLKKIVADCCRLLSNERTAGIVDDIKRLGFQFATKSGITIGIHDVQVPHQKVELLEEGDRRIAEIERQFQRGLITEQERYNSAIEVWSEISDRISEAVANSMDPFGSIYMMATSGAKGNIAQIRQMAGMRGLMTDPAGRIIDLPIRSSFREGLTVLEYFISTHGARKGLADTALRTADSGYLTRRLIDISQDVIVQHDDCGTTSGIWIIEPGDRGMLPPLEERIMGRLAAAPIVDPQTGEIMVDRNGEIDEPTSKRIAAAGVTRCYVRSPMSCQAKRGICQRCYGFSLGRGRLVRKGEAVGIIAAQSIGEPGTQLTMRTFHTGGVAGLDITSGLPRVEELFEARVPKGQAIISEIDGVANIIQDEMGRHIKVSSTDVFRDEYPLPTGHEPIVKSGEWVNAGTLLTKRVDVEPAVGDEKLPVPESASGLMARMSGKVAVDSTNISIIYEETEDRDYQIPATSRLAVTDGQPVHAGDRLTDGSINPQDILRIMGRDAVQQYMVEETQKVYRSQGVNINDKHIEVIVRQMLRKVRLDSPGDTDLLPGELVDRFAYEDINAKVLAEGGEPATAQTVLLGVTKASLNTDSFLAAASFQETTRVLTEAAINGSIDRLQGLKENVIIGKLIPARALQMPEPEPAMPLPFMPLPFSDEQAPSEEASVPEENAAVDE